MAVARLVLYDKLGPGTHRCHWCDQPVTWTPGKGIHPDALVADHLDWNNRDDSPANLVPSCNACNAHRTRAGDRRLIGSAESYVVNANGTKTRAAEVVCEQCGTAFLARLSQLRTGKGRFCSRSCARRYSMLNHRR